MEYSLVLVLWKVQLQFIFPLVYRLVVSVALANFSIVCIKNLIKFLLN